MIRVGEVPGSNPGAPIKAPQMRGFFLLSYPVRWADLGPNAAVFSLGRGKKYLQIWVFR